MKKYNFSAGPSILPQEVIKQTADAVLEFQGEGLSILEISHRAKYFQPVLDEAEALMKELLQIPDGYKTIFLGGGASMQFCMLPFNMLEKKEGHSNEPGPDKNGKNLASKKKKSSAADNLQLSFFQLEDPLLCDLRDSIKAMDINAMSPLDAFDAIRKLKEKLGLKK